MQRIPASWQDVLKAISQQDNFTQLAHSVDYEYAHFTVYPEPTAIWQALEWTPYERVKVVILGQDPYHTAGMAHGLSFSVRPGYKLPPSLRNIYKELEADLGYEPVNHGFLKKWAQLGVLLLNTVLTVRKGEANSHKNLGWQSVTDEIIRVVNQLTHPVVFILWGNQAISKRQLIDESRHYVIESSHPSPLSARHSFFGSRPFSKANHYLLESGQESIDWQLPIEPYTI